VRPVSCAAADPSRYGPRNASPGARIPAWLRASREPSIRPRKWTTRRRLATTLSPAHIAQSSRVVGCCSAVSPDGPLGCMPHRLAPGSECSHPCSHVVSNVFPRSHRRGRHGSLDSRKPRICGAFPCAQGDSNSHGPNGPQGPQPCALPALLVRMPRIRTSDPFGWTIWTLWRKALLSRRSQAAHQSQRIA
jgi:hypothetical protein